MIFIIIIYFAIILFVGFRTKKSSDAKNFIYAGRTSEEFGLLNVNVNNGLYEESFLPRRQIIEEKISTVEKELITFAKIIFKKLNPIKLVMKFMTR